MITGTRHADPPGRDAPLSAQDVRTAYLLFLGREPESDAVVQAWQAKGSIEELRRMFLASAEFREKNPELMQAPDREGSNRPPFVSLDAPPLAVEWEADETVLDGILAHIRTIWTRLGEERPHWSVLSAEQFTPEHIANHAPEFFDSGEHNAAELTACLRRHGLLARQFQRVFEYGCGVGRVTPHLARHFTQVTACDVSASHLDIAQRVVAGAGLSNVSFSLVKGAEFGMTGPFDLWFSQIVLQHNPPPIIALILRRAFSLLAPGGAAVFQVPTYAVSYRFDIGEYFQGISADGGIEMHVLPQAVIFRLAREAGCEPVEVWHDNYVGLDPTAWVSNTFIFRKTAAR